MKKFSKKQLKKINRKLKKMKFSDKYQKQNFIRNLDIFENNLKNYNWWDYGFLNDFIITILKDMEKHYGVDSHFVGDEKVKKKIQKLLKIYDEIDDIKEDYKKFYCQLGKNINYFWD